MKKEYSLCGIKQDCCQICLNGICFGDQSCQRTSWEICKSKREVTSTTLLPNILEMNLQHCTRAPYMNIHRDVQIGERWQFMALLPNMHKSSTIQCSHQVLLRRSKLKNNHNVDHILISYTNSNSNTPLVVQMPNMLRPNLHLSTLSTMECC